MIEYLGKVYNFTFLKGIVQENIPKTITIQQQLYISEGTAKTHIRHIYRKLNIHSQQDLIHLIDGVEL